MGKRSNNLRFSKSFVAIFVTAMFLLPLSVYGQPTASKPSTPEFSASYVADGYYVPPTYKVDPFTGENITIQQGYHVDTNSIVLKIKNQPFTSTYWSYGNTSLYYNFRLKGHFTEEWTYYPFNEKGLSGRYFAGYTEAVQFPVFEASTGEFTELSIKIGKVFFNDVPEGGMVDVEVQAQTGFIQSLADGFYQFTGESSDWSSIQTVIITSTPTTNPQATPTPTSLNTSAINQNGIEIYSNSTISFFSVNNTSSEINFTVSGPTSTAGFVKILISKSFIPNSNVKVYLDGSEISYQLDETGNSWVITFNYNHSAHQVTIRAISNNIANSELPDWVWIAAIAAVGAGLGLSGGIFFYISKKKT